MIFIIMFIGMNLFNLDLIELLDFSRDAMITVAVNSLTSFASGFVIFMFLVS